MRVNVDDQRCQGHTRCHAIAPDIFQLRDSDGHAFVDPDDFPDALEATVKRAVNACPERAVSLTHASSVSAGSDSDVKEGTP